MVTSLSQRLRLLAQDDPAAPAVTVGSSTLTRRALDERSEALAVEMARQGVRQGDVVSVVLANSIDQPVAVVATWKLGATPQPLSPKLSSRELREIVELTRPRLVVGVTDPDVVGALPALPAGHEPEPLPVGTPPLPDVVAPSWKAPTTGGSTGRPKVIRDATPGVYEGVAAYAQLTRYRPGTTALLTSPLSHNAGFMALATTLTGGGHAVVMPRFDAEEMLRLIELHGVSWLLVVPTMMTRVCKLPREVRDRYDVSSLETVFHGAAACPPDVKEEWLHWLGPEKVIEVYASTEAHAITMIEGSQWLSHRGSVGTLLVGEIEVRDDEGRPLPTGQVGRLWARRGPGLQTYQYVGAEARGDGHGWETVGDLGWFDEDGYLYLADRDSDMLVVGGANVYPAELEAVLLEHPLVLEACVVGRPDADLGQAPHAVLHTEGGEAVADLDAFVAGRLAVYKRPRTYEFVPEPIRDEAGKIRRATLALQPAAVGEERTR